MATDNCHLLRKDNAKTGSEQICFTMMTYVLRLGVKEFKAAVKHYRCGGFPLPLPPSPNCELVMYIGLNGLVRGRFSRL